MYRHSPAYADLIDRLADAVNGDDADCQRNNRLQIEHGLQAAGVDTLRLVVTDLRARIAREQAAPDAEHTLAIAERELARREGHNDE